MKIRQISSRDSPFWFKLMCFQVLLDQENFWHSDPEAVLQAQEFYHWGAVEAGRLNNLVFHVLSLSHHVFHCLRACPDHGEWFVRWGYPEWNFDRLRFLEKTVKIIQSTRVGRWSCAVYVHGCMNSLWPSCSICAFFSFHIFRMCRAVALVDLGKMLCFARLPKWVLAWWRFHCEASRK